MNLKSSLFALALLFPATAFAEDAPAPDFVECADKPEGEKAKCNAKAAKAVGKARAASTLYKPSALSDKFAGLDEDAKNPFNLDSFYVGVTETGSKDVDAVLASVAKIDGAIAMAYYIGYLSKTGKSDDAKALATDLIPVLTKLGDDVKAIKESIDKIQANPTAVASSPAAVPKIVKALGPAAVTVGGAAAELPKALGAIQPIAAGAAGAAVEAAGDTAKDAVGQ